MAPKEVLDPRPHGADRAPRGTTAIVVGGGIAGLAAGSVLAERGVHVTLCERESFLGGRAGSWPDRLQDGTAFHMERGFHAFFRQYYNLKNLLRRVDPCLTNLSPTTDYPLLGPDGRAESFSDLPLRAPWNLVALMWRSPSISLGDLRRIDQTTARQMLAFDPERTYARWDDASARDYLDALGFPPDARQMLFDVFAHSFFNPEASFSAAELLMMFHYYFLANPEGLVFDVATRPFGLAFWEPLGRRLTRLGGRILLQTSVERLERRAGRWAVHVEREPEPLTADLVVLAVTVPALQKLITASFETLRDGPWQRQIEGLGVTDRFAVWRGWLDRPLAPQRAPFAGTTGVGILDNISRYERLEDESLAWSRTHGGSVVELHAYSIPPDMTEDAIQTDMLRGLHTLYPESRHARALETRYLVRQDCPAFAPGSHAARPGVATPYAGLALAGDFVKMPFPTALMERAAASGFFAANTLLEPYNVRSEPLWSISPYGLVRAG